MPDALTSFEVEERRAIVAGVTAGPSDAWYEAIRDLAVAAERRAPSYAEACRGIYGRTPGLRDVERAAIRAEGSAALRPKILRARPAQPPAEATPWKDRKFCNPPQATAESLAKLPASADLVDVDPGSWAPRDRPGGWVDPRRESWQLTEAVRELGQARQVWCRRALLAGAAGLEGHRQGRLAWTGTETCSSVWACPTCSWRIRAHRGVELSELVRIIRETTPQTETGLESRAGTGGLMLTLTLRHCWSDDLTDLRRMLTRSWSRFIRGAPFARFKRAAGLIGFVRSVEVTHGKRGWHPHLHAMIVGDPGWNRRRYAGMDVETWMRRRWLAAVRAEGERDGSLAGHVPSWAHALKLSPIRPGYLEKMGLELVLAPDKRGGHGNRTPWQIADDWRRCRRKRSARLWKTYAASMKGAKFLTWSRALRRWAGLGSSVADATIAADKGIPLGSLPGAAWRAIRDAKDFRTGRSVLCLALELGERKGVRAALRYCWREAGPRLNRKGKHDGRLSGATSKGRSGAAGWRSAAVTEAQASEGALLQMRQTDSLRVGQGRARSHGSMCSLRTMDPNQARRHDHGGVVRAQPECGTECHGDNDRADDQQRDGMDGRSERDGASFAAAMLAAVFAERDREAAADVS